MSAAMMASVEVEIEMVLNTMTSKGLHSSSRLGDQG
jgi:hypothetical protein